MSSIALLGVPSEMYVYGTLYATIVVSYPICMAITARFYMPVFHDLGVISSFEVLLLLKKSLREILVLSFFFRAVFRVAVQQARPPPGGRPLLPLHGEVLKSRVTSLQRDLPREFTIFR